MTRVGYINVTVSNTSSKIGIFRPGSGIWSLDSNGNSVWEVSDKSLSWGLPNEKPEIGKEQASGVLFRKSVKYC
jgi:hypothetical protein